MILWTVALRSLVWCVPEKMQRKNISWEELEEKVEDIAGIRIICQFEEDIETVASLIQNRSDMTIKSEKKYLRAAIEVLS